MSIRKGRWLSGVLTAVLVVVLGSVTSASADISPQACRTENPVNPSGGAEAEIRLCYSPNGDGYYLMTWEGTIRDQQIDSSGAAAQITYVTPYGRWTWTYETHGAGTHKNFSDGDNGGKDLRVRACQINGGKVHICSDWF